MHCRSRSGRARWPAPWPWPRSPPWWWASWRRSRLPLPAGTRTCRCPSRAFRQIRHIFSLFCCLALIRNKPLNSGLVRVLCTLPANNVVLRQHDLIDLAVKGSLRHNASVSLWSLLSDYAENNVYNAQTTRFLCCIVYGFFTKLTSCSFVGSRVASGVRRCRPGLLGGAVRAAR